MLKDPDGFARSDAAKALAVWGGPENTPALVESLRDPAFNVRWAVLDTIATLKDPAAAEPVAVLLVNDRGKASEALRAIGSPAEAAVIKYLNHGDVFVRMESAKILQAIGTEKCVPALQALLRRTGGNGLDAMAARDTLRFLGAPEFPSPSRRKAGARVGR
jgi:HEAT repeat protein